MNIITAKIAFIFTSLSAVHKYDFHKFTVEVITVTITCIWFFNILSLPLQINLICHLRIRPGENQIGDQSVVDDVNIRSFQSFDQQICQEIFTKCCETWIKDALRMDCQDIAHTLGSRVSSHSSPWLFHGPFTVSAYILELFSLLC